MSPTPVADIEGIFLWIKGYSVDQAYRWVRGCYEIMLTLEKFPNRCPLAVESKYMNLPVRQLLYKKQYRILFTVGESKVQDSQGKDSGQHLDLRWSFRILHPSSLIPHPSPFTQYLVKIAITSPGLPSASVDSRHLAQRSPTCAASEPPAAPPLASQTACVEWVPWFETYLSDWQVEQSHSKLSAQTLGT